MTLSTHNIKNVFVGLFVTGCSIVAIQPLCKVLCFCTLRLYIHKSTSSRIHFALTLQYVTLVMFGFLERTFQIEIWPRRCVLTAFGILDYRRSRMFGLRVWTRVVCLFLFHKRGKWIHQLWQSYHTSVLAVWCVLPRGTVLIHPNTTFMSPTGRCWIYWSLQSLRCPLMSLALLQSFTLWVLFFMNHGWSAHHSKHASLCFLLWSQTLQSSRTASKSLWKLWRTTFSHACPLLRETSSET